jgi:hypothetical protein
MLPVAHIAGIPVEETLGMFGPAIATMAGAASFTVRSRWRRIRGGSRRPAGKELSRYGGSASGANEHEPQIREIPGGDDPLQAPIDEETR